MSASSSDRYESFFTQMLSLVRMLPPPKIVNGRFSHKRDRKEIVRCMPNFVIPAEAGIPALPG